MKVVISFTTENTRYVRLLDGPRSSRSVRIYYNPDLDFMKSSVNPSEGWSEGDWDRFSSFREVKGMGREEFFRLEDNSYRLNGIDPRSEEKKRYGIPPKDPEELKEIGRREILKALKSFDLFYR